MSIIERDICIVGGGMIGASAAIAFANLGYSVSVLELHQPKGFEKTQNPDLRVSALNHASLDFLKQHDVWKHVQQMRYRNYERLDVWESNEQATSFHASEINHSSLGAFVENRILQLALLASIEETFADKIDLIVGQKIKNISHQTQEIELEDGQLIKSQMIIGADGANSFVRKSANIGETGWDYQQSASLITIKLTEEFEDCTWQQFTPSGPLAFLPMHNKYACLVWYGNKKQTQAINAADNIQLYGMIKETFPERLGEFLVLDKGSFPLRRMHANHYYRDATVLLGDAAHTINPLAGQGVNLGFKDLISLIQATKDSGLGKRLNATAPELQEALSRYEKQRKSENLLMMTSMDFIYHSFSNTNPILKPLRNMGLAIADKAGPLKVRALKYAVGIL